MRIRILPEAEHDLEIGADFYEAMNAGRLFLTPLIAFLLASPSLATDYAPRTAAEMAQRADLVVVGVAAIDNGKMVIRVSEALKGDTTNLATLNRAVAGPFGEVVITSGDRGVFFLHKHGAGY